jgi:DNA modification methylase
MDWTVIAGDALQLLKEVPDNSVDSLVSDPPGGIEFMGRDWDTFRSGRRSKGWACCNKTGGDGFGGFGKTLRPAFHTQGRGARESFVAAMTEIFVEVNRVLKPGAHALVWGIPRTSHWTAWALEEAGFEVRDVIHHVFGQGMPKSQDMAKSIDKRLGVAGSWGEPKSAAHAGLIGRGGRNPGVALVKKPWMDDPEAFDRLQCEYQPGSAEAAQWEGWGTALKPAHEYWILARKPVEGSITANVLKHGTGALNIDACRVARAEGDVPGWHQSGANGSQGFQGEATFKIRAMSPEEIQARCGDKGRWPPNLLLSGEAVAEMDRQSGTSRSRKGKPRAAQEAGEGWGMTHTGAEYDDEGGASRFFPCFGYFPKPGRAEKEAGLEAFADATLNRVNPGGLEREERFAPVQVKNNHPTVKGIDLMRWLCRLVTPPGGLVLDPFCGSGSTGCAAVLEGFRFLGMEQDPEFAAKAEARIAHWEKQR